MINFCACHICNPDNIHTYPYLSILIHLCSAGWSCAGQRNKPWPMTLKESALTTMLVQLNHFWDSFLSDPLLAPDMWPFFISTFYLVSTKASTIRKCIFDYFFVGWIKELTIILYLLLAYVEHILYLTLFLVEYKEIQ